MKADASRVLVRKHLRPYFTVFLPKQRGCSDNTIQSIHDTWNLFLRYLSAAKGIDNSRLAFSDIDPAVVTGFLDQMEFEKGWKPSTRNKRLSCLRSFFRYAASMEPVLYPCSAALGEIPLKKGADRSYVIEFLSPEEMKSLLAVPDTKTRLGVRDQFFMALMYDSAARDCEMLGLKLEDFHEDNNTVYLWGKGAKPRLVPVSGETTALFVNYRRKFHQGSALQEPLFYTIHKREKTPMSDDNVARFLKKYADLARMEKPDIPERIHPHMFRKSRAMHLYRAGMPLALLAEFLGHEDPETTRIYAYADTEMKRKAIEKASQNVGEVASLPTEKAFWEGDDDIIGRLCRGY